MDPTARPSPKGILDFLSRKCRFETTYRDRFLPEKKVLEKIFNFLLPMKDEKNWAPTEILLEQFEANNEYRKRPVCDKCH